MSIPSTQLDNSCSLVVASPRAMVATPTYMELYYLTTLYFDISIHTIN